MTASLYKEPEAGKLYWIRRYPKPFPDGSIFQISNLEMKINLSAYVKNWRCDWRESGGERFYLEEVENDDE